MCFSAMEMPFDASSGHRAAVRMAGDLNSDFMSSAIVLLLISEGRESIWSEERGA